MKLNFLLPFISACLFSITIQAQSDVTRHLLEELLEEKMKGITIQSSERESTDVGIGAEPFIHISPFNSDLMGIAYMGAGGSWNLSLSEDGGTSWSEANLNTLNILSEVHPNSQLLGGGDPTFVIDEDDIIHLTFIYLYIPEDGSFADQDTWTLELFYAFSDDFGQSWTPGESLVSGTLAETDLGFVDRIWMDIDADQNIYCGGTHFGSSEETGEQGTIVFKKINDNPEFSLPAETAMLVPSLDSQTQFTNVETGDDGSVHVSGIMITPDVETIIYAKSDSNGENYTAYTEIASSVSFPGNTEVHSRENSAVSLSVDGDNVYIAWSDFQDGNVLGYYVYSHDGGDTFTSPISIGDLYSGDTHHILMPCVAAHDGNLAITWHTVDKETSEGEYIAAYSDDAGVTLSTLYYSISDDFTSFANFGQNSFFGDYNSMKMDGTVAHIAWCDAHTSGSPRVYYTAIDFSTAPTQIAETQPLSSQLQVNTIFPNPASSNISISLQNLDAKTLVIQMLSVEGKLVFSETSSLVQGENILPLALSDVPSGVYQLKLTNDKGFVVTKKIVIE